MNRSTSIKDRLARVWETAYHVSYAVGAPFRTWRKSRREGVTFSEALQRQADELRAEMTDEERAELNKRERLR